MTLPLLSAANKNLNDYPGNTASQAIDLLIKKGVPESRIVFLNLISVSYIQLNTSNAPCLMDTSKVISINHFRLPREYVVYVNVSHI